MNKRLFLSPPHMGGTELPYIQEAFGSNYIAPLGPMVDAFEKEFAAYTGIPHCLALSSGTAAMHLALRELGVGPGDEVLGSTLTFIGSVNSAVYLQANLAFIDADPVSWNMDPNLLAEELAACARRGRLPKAVIPTDLYGQCCDLPRIRQICDRYEVPVVSDSAEAVGARYKEEGRRKIAEVGDTAEGRRMKDEVGKGNGNGHGNGHDGEHSRRWVHAGYGAGAAVYSFNGNKIITTSGGGMLASHDPELIAHARKLSQQARDVAPHYEHTEIGYNYRMSNIVAAIGRGQLRVVEERVARKREILEGYRRLLGDLPGITFMPEASYNRANRWLTVVLVDPAWFGASREEIRLALEAENIESRPLWKPMHVQPVFKGCRVRGGAVSEGLFARGLCLPSGTAMADADVERVAGIVRRCARPARGAVRGQVAPVKG